jgi:uncharacterized protein
MSPSWKASHGQLPVTIDPIQLAERGARLTGTLPLKSMARLTQNCRDGAGDVFVDLAFERGVGEKVFLMHGTLRVQLRTTCQRCLEGMDINLEASPSLVLLRSEAAQDLSGDDPDTLVADKPVSLIALVEDELLLVLPMVPMHELSQCPAKKYVAEKAGTDIRDVVKGERKNPFAVLKDRKSRDS